MVPILCPRGDLHVNHTPSTRRASCPSRSFVGVATRSQVWYWPEVAAVMCWCGGPPPTEVEAKSGAARSTAASPAPREDRHLAEAPCDRLEHFTAPPDRDDHPAERL